MKQPHMRVSRLVVVGVVMVGAWAGILTNDVQARPPWRAATTGNASPPATWEDADGAAASGAPDIGSPSRAVALTRVEHGSTSAFNLCLFDGPRFKDGTFTIAFRAERGETDQGGGPAWRVVDENNYYLCRANPLEDNLRLYVVKDGQRRQLASVKAEAPAGVWHTIRVTHEGESIRCVLDGTFTVESRDATLAGPGGVGLWTKADAATSFVAPAAWWGEAGVDEAPGGAGLDTAAIERITGLKVTVFPDEPGAPVFKVTQPRNDVPITIEGRKLEPFMGLTTWAAFRPGEKAKAMVSGDLVVFTDEVTPVMDALFAHGCTVTALHNHFLFDEPRVMFLHFGGEGAAESLAGGFRAALDAIKAVRAAAPDPASVRGYGGDSVPTVNAITPAPLDAILFAGAKPGGAVKDGMYKAVFGREVSMSCGCRVGKESGINTWAAFCGDDAHAAVAGDFITFAGELQPVLRALRKAGIHIVTIHNHMEGETPPSIFLHYWGKGRAADLAQGIKAALAAQAAAHSR
jgi:hypothetical protein